jgi:hypothetical protein
MDALDRIAPPADGLLAQVDDTLVRCGAPPEHPIWVLLRRVGALPGEAVTAIVALRPGSAEAAAAEVRVLAGEYVRVRAGVGEAPEWTGAAAQAYAARWRDLGRHLVGGAERLGTGAEHLGAGAEPDEASMAGRLAATAGYLTDVGDWMRTARDAMAGELASVLSSAEAVWLRTPTAGGPDGAPSLDAIATSATVGARVLSAAAGAVDRGRLVHERWASRLGELPYRASVQEHPTFGGTTSVPL